MEKKREELMELRHEAVPGFRTVFGIVFSVCVIYLGIILWRTMAS